MPNPSSGSVKSGRKTNPTIATSGGGNAVALSATSQSGSDGVTVTALATNTDTVAIGDSTVNSLAGYETGHVLQPGASVGIDIDDIQKLYLAVNVANEGVSYNAFG